MQLSSIQSVVGPVPEALPSIVLSIFNQDYGADQIFSYDGHQIAAIYDGGGGV